MRLPHGEFVEIHEPLSKEELWKLTSHEQAGALEIPETDANGVRLKGSLQNRLRTYWSKAHSEQITKPTAKELESDTSHH